jgi:hypothetical protein
MIPHNLKGRGKDGCFYNHKTCMVGIMVIVWETTRKSQCSSQEALPNPKQLTQSRHLLQGEGEEEREHYPIVIVIRGILMRLLTTDYSIDSAEKGK